MTSAPTFLDRLSGRWRQGLFVCVGIDSQLGRLPLAIHEAGTQDPQVAFNQAIVRATREVVCAYKANLGFYLERGPEGLRALRESIESIRIEAPDVPVILDAKFGDIGSSSEAYARFAFDVIGADAVTVQPYLGGDSLAPFLARRERGVFVLCRTSNPTAGDLQDLAVDAGQEGPIQLYEEVATRVVRDWNYNGNCGVVAGATYPVDLSRVRAGAADLPILIPGVGEQGGDVAAAVDAARDSRGTGFLVNASRSIVFASGGPEFAAAAKEAAAKLHTEIQSAMVRRGARP